MSIVFTWDKQRRSQWCQVVAVSEKNQAECEELPPTKAALHEHILCARPEYDIWLTSRIQYLPYEWTNEEGCHCPVRTLLKPALDAVIELIH